MRIDGELVSFVIPPVTGTHRECFNPSNECKSIRFATGRETIGYSCAALDRNRKYEWTEDLFVRFPRMAFLRFRKTLTIIPLNTRFGPFSGGLFVDEDLKGLGIESPIEKIPGDISDWNSPFEGIYSKGDRLFVSHESWYTGTWRRNGLSLALSGSRDAAESLENAADSYGVSYNPLWRVDPSKISSPVKSVPVLLSQHRRDLILSCSAGAGEGCAIQVLNQELRLA